MLNCQRDIASNMENRWPSNKFWKGEPTLKPLLASLFTLHYDEVNFQLFFLTASPLHARLN
jgi:hypothetical protein